MTLEQIEESATQLVEEAARSAKARKESHAPNPQELEVGVYAAPFTK